MQRGALLILLIGLIIIIGGLAAFLILRSSEPADTTSQTPEVPPPLTEVPRVLVVQARVDLEANTLLNDPTVLEVAEVPITEFDEAQEFSKISDVLGKLLINPVPAGQPIRRADLRDAGLAQRIPTPEPGQPRVKAYPLPVNIISGVADQIAVGDFVDIIATFSVERQIFRPNITQPIEDNQPVSRFVESQEFFFATKTIIQRAQVLQIVRPAVPTAPSDGGGAGPSETIPPPQSSSLPQVDASGQPITGGQVVEGGTGGVSTLTQGFWMVVLGLTDQEIELLEFALQSNARIVLALRGADDILIEETSGATLDILVREFGLPLPRPLPPQVYSEDEFLQPTP
ncbi:Flp pilus assembly protein CpaB [Chloroflexus sp. Y-396-1]|uniref:Flp pilus assembly protein CpaB n=1 Tax=Chloroflexus sp. Y-396-1 TaxID=867845 RepID=UPI00048EC757|nr:SAF domain-containing protein [Chloroflexus sp. Y-396-1]